MFFRLKVIYLLHVNFDGHAVYQNFVVKNLSEHYPDP